MFPALAVAAKHQEQVVRVGFDPAYGARPLKRSSQKEIETPLARMLLTGDVRDGMTVTVDYDQSHDRLSFRPTAGQVGSGA